MSKIDDVLHSISDRLEMLQETIENRLDTMTISIDTLTRGLSVMVDTQRTQSDMLSEVLVACSADPGASSELTETLERIVEAVERQNETLGSIDGHLSGLGTVIELSVVRGIDRADSKREAIDAGLVDEDGIFLDADE